MSAVAWLWDARWDGRDMIVLLVAVGGLLWALCRYGDARQASIWAEQDAEPGEGATPPPHASQQGAQRPKGR